jgi:hypothetical protein
MMHYVSEQAQTWRLIRDDLPTRCITDRNEKNSRVFIYQVIGWCRMSRELKQQENSQIFDGNQWEIKH